MSIVNNYLVKGSLDLTAEDSFARKKHINGIVLLPLPVYIKNIPHHHHHFSDRVLVVSVSDEHEEQNSLCYISSTLQTMRIIDIKN